MDAADDIEDWTGSVEMDFLQNFQFEASYRDNNFIDGAYFTKVRFTLGGNSNKPVAASSRFIDDEPWRMHNMADCVHRVCEGGAIAVDRRKTIGKPMDFR